MTWVHLPNLASSLATEASRWVLDSLAYQSRPCATSKSTPTANKSSRPESQTATWTMLPFGTTSQPSTGDPGVDTWIWLLAVSRANLIPWRENESAVLINAISGRTPLESFGKLDHLSCSLKMSLESSPKPTSQEGYLAGLIDGEGTISIWGKSGKQYYPCIQVGMSEKALPMLRSLCETYGGNVRQFRLATSAWNAGWIWSIFGAEAEAILLKIHSSLRLKQPHATLALRLFALIASLEAPTGKRKRWTPEAREHAAVLAIMMKELNKKGPEAVSEMVKNHPILDCNNIWVTPQLDFLGTAEPWSGSFPKQGMTVSGTAYRLRKREHPTNGNGGGYWPTPRSSSGGGNRNSGPNSPYRPALAQVVTLWPTPRAGKTTDETEESWLARQAAGKVSTPPLTLAVKMWPTPGTQESTGGPGNAEHMKQQGHQVKLKDAVGGQLNPTWVGALIGLPHDWTSLSPMSVLEYNKWFMWFTDEILPSLQQAAGEEAIQREAGRQRSVPEPPPLQSEMREYSGHIDEAWLQLEGQEASQSGLRGVSRDSQVDSPPHQPGHHQQRPIEYPDPVQVVPRLLPQHGRQAWQDGSWEDGIPRVATGVAHRVDRLKALGNGIVPAVVAKFLRGNLGRV